MRPNGVKLLNKPQEEKGKGLKDCRNEKTGKRLGMEWLDKEKGGARIIRHRRQTKAN